MDDFSFRSKIRSAAGSIMDNIAEGYQRDGNKEFIQFLYIAKGSCGEVRSQSYRAIDYDYISTNEHKELLKQSIKISRKISKLIQHLKDAPFKGRKYL